MTASLSSTQWLVGWVIGIVIVVLVVALLVAIIYLAAKVRRELLAVHAALSDTRDNTAALWELQTTMSATDRILASAKAAGSALEEREA